MYIKFPLYTYKHLNKDPYPIGITLYLSQFTYKCSPEDTCTAPDTITTRLFSYSQIPL